MSTSATTPVPVEGRPSMAGPPELTVVVPTRNEEGNVARLCALLDDALAHVSCEVVFVDDSDDGTPDAVRLAAARTRAPVRLVHREPPDRASGLGGAVVEGLRTRARHLGLRHGRRPAAPARARRATARPRSRRRLRRRRGQPVPPEGDAERFAAARRLVSLGQQGGRAPALPEPPPGGLGPDERLLRRPPERRRPRPPAPARVQDPRRAARADAAAARGRDRLPLRRALRRREQGRRPRGGPLPRPAPDRAPRRRTAALRALRARRADRSGGQHRRPGGVHLGRGHLLPDLGDPRDAGLDAVELRADGGVGVPRARDGPAGQPPRRPVLRDEQRRDAPAHPAAAGPDVRARGELPHLEHRLADGADARAVRPGRQLDLAGAADARRPRGPGGRLELRRARHRHRAQ